MDISELLDTFKLKTEMIREIIKYFILFYSTIGHIHSRQFFIQGSIDLFRDRAVRPDLPIGQRSRHFFFGYFGSLSAIRRKNLKTRDHHVQVHASPMSLLLASPKVRVLPDSPNQRND